MEGGGDEVETSIHFQGSFWQKRVPILLRPFLKIFAHLHNFFDVCMMTLDPKFWKFEKIDPCVLMFLLKM